MYFDFLKALAVAQDVVNCKTKQKDVFLKLYTSTTQKLTELENILFKIQASIPDGGTCIQKYHYKISMISKIVKSQ